MNKLVFRWPVELTAANNEILVSDGTSFASEAIPAGTYLVKGETGTSGPDDLLDALATAVDAAMTTLGLAGSSSFSITSGGRVQFGTSGLSSGTQVELHWDNVLTTLEPTIFGVDVNNSPWISQHTVFGGTLVTSEWQHGYGWYPNEVVAVDTYEQKRWRTFQTGGAGVSPSFFASRANHSQNVIYVRGISWEFVTAPRLWHSWGEIQEAADAAGLNLNDPNAALENLFEDSFDSQAVNNAEVYIYDTTDPDTHSVSGPYQLQWPGDWVDQGGIPFERIVRRDAGLAQADMALAFVRSS